MASMGSTTEAPSGSCKNYNTLFRPNKRQRLDDVECTATSSRFKGVVLQYNEHWGAQIYSNCKRIWLGTFKTEEEAAMVYDSASLMFKTGDSHRNFPLSNLTIHEKRFQSQHSTESVMNMLKYGSYYSKLMVFVRAQPQKIENTESHGHQIGREGIYQLLFQKELTPSDVGKLNRLVIPKRYAVEYFPEVSKDGADDLELTLFDGQMNSWSFRYCYWPSSQSYVFTRGWHRFVKVKGLKANDVVKFYKCESEEKKVFYTIDVQYNVSKDKSDFFGGLNTNVGEEVELELDIGRSASSHATESDEENVALSLAYNAVKKRKVLRLFGADISITE